MNIYETMQNKLTVPQVARFYGLDIQPDGLAQCPVCEGHPHTLKLEEDSFFCPQCEASGDAIDLVALRFGLSPIDAARKLAADFEDVTHLSQLRPAAGVIIPLAHTPEFKEAENSWFMTLRSYLRLLEGFRQECGRRYPSDSIPVIDQGLVSTAKLVDYLLFDRDELRLLVVHDLELSAMQEEEEYE